MLICVKFGEKTLDEGLKIMRNTYFSSQSKIVLGNDKQLVQVCWWKNNKFVSTTVTNTKSQKVLMIFAVFSYSYSYKSICCSSMTQLTLTNAERKCRRFGTCCCAREKVRSFSTGSNNMPIPGGKLHTGCLTWIELSYSERFSKRQSDGSKQECNWNGSHEIQSLKPQSTNSLRSSKLDSYSVRKQRQTHSRCQIPLPKRAKYGYCSLRSQSQDRVISNRWINPL
jgi:hypothetical protein